VCACGAVCQEAIDPSMMTVISHCASRRIDGSAFDARSPVAPTVDVAGGTSVILWRTDPVSCLWRSEQLVAHRLRPESPSRRMVTSRCDTPRFGDFTRGFWISIYSDWVTDAPPPSMRVMRGDAPDGVAFPDEGAPRFHGRPRNSLVSL
jgi:hypothetical protein